ncbi:fatty acid desaturase family protein [Limnohabitans sp. Rim8]|uniref:fatty acid desaturase family protein n=1 Tax=Limnohabitans sp. Rim8 TaxID=1100718 RepID=UPI00261C739C|nr:fatty acid desaturase family protein [Limnohabitans sp. Rim8]
MANVDATHPMLTPEQDAFLRERSDWMGAYLVLHAWGMVALAMAFFVAWPNPLSFIVAVIVIGGRQLGMAILMHDAAHRALFKNTWLNDKLGAFLCGWPVGASLTLYRPYHLSHHRHTQQPEDPDLILSAPFPITRQSFWRKMRRDILGITGYQRRMEFFRMEMGDDPNPWQRLKKLMAAEKYFFFSNLLIFAVTAAAGVWWAYFALWLLPLLTWYQVISRVRNIAEHAVVGDNHDRLRNTRTTLTHWGMRMVLAPYWVNYHLEHHLFVFTPCWKLPAAHRMLIEQGLGPRMELATGYVQVLRLATSKKSDHGDTGGTQSQRKGAALI